MTDEVSRLFRHADIDLFVRQMEEYPEVKLFEAGNDNYGNMPLMFVSWP